MEQQSTTTDSETAKQPSDELTDRGKELAERAGDVYRETVEYFVENVAETGGSTEVDDYFLGFAQEEAEGVYSLESDGELAWNVPDDENCHVEVVVADRADGRFVPELDVTATLEDGAGFETEFAVPFLWHPSMFHYGQNVEVPGDGTYDLTVTVAAPTFMRHDEENGDRYVENVEVTFEDVEIETGQDLPEE